MHFKIKEGQVSQKYLCTTRKKRTINLKKVSDLHNIKIFRGSTNNVAKRLIDCAKLNHVEIIVRITGDCPIIDPKLIDDCIKLHFKRKKDYTTNTLKLSFPDGLDVEVFNTDALIKSQKMSKTKLNKEHVTYYMRRSKNLQSLIINIILITQIGDGL